MIRLWNWIMWMYWKRKLERINWEGEVHEKGKCSECGEFVGNDAGLRLIECKCERMYDVYCVKLGMEYDTACDGCRWCDKNERRNG